MLFNFVLVWLYKYFDMSVTDEGYVDETRVWSGVINYNPGIDYLSCILQNFQKFLVLLVFGEEEEYNKKLTTR